MSRIAERFRALKARGECALVPFVTAGDPDLETTAALLPAMERAGADLIEIGVPFSDPIAEGLTIQRASERALAQGTTLRSILALVADVRPSIEIPLLLMGYANPVFALGVEHFARTAAASGVDGIILPDLPPEEGAELYAVCREHGVDAILLGAPTSTPERMAMLARETRGFLYYVSLTGVTGARQELAAGIEEKVREAKRSADVPVCVGFGVSHPEQAAEISRYADGVVVGSAVIDRIARSRSREDVLSSVTRFLTELKQPLRNRP